MNNAGRCERGSNDDDVKIWVQRPMKSLLTLGTRYYDDCIWQASKTWQVLSLAGMTMPTSKSWRQQRQGGRQHRKPLNQQRIKLSTLPLIEIIWKINTFIASFQICIWKSITEFFQMSCLKAVSGPQNCTDRTATWEAPIVSWEHFPNVYTLLEICSKFPFETYSVDNHANHSIILLFKCSTFKLNFKAMFSSTPFKFACVL